MALSNRDRVNKGLEALRDGLAPFFAKQMEVEYRARWRDVAAQGLEKGQDPEADIHAMLKVILDQWRNVFGKTLSRSERNLVHELLDVRNRWAHQEAFSTEDADRALDSVVRILRSISAPQADEVERQRQEILRIRFEEQAKREVKKATLAPVEGQPAAGFKSWREVVTPHPDVASGRYQQAEFAADLAQVHRGEGADEYRDPREFYRRTFITEGLRQLLVLALQRLSGTGGDPVVDLQTNFGGGKTHSLLALYHLFSGVSAADLPGVEAVLKDSRLDSAPKASRAVIVGTAISPGQPHKKDDGTEVHTLWGEIAWQLGGKGGYKLVAEADQTATNPPRHALQELFKQHSPCLVLIDEWVAYARQLVRDTTLPAGTMDTHATFAQALTEAVKSVPETLLVVSIPVSERASEGGSERESGEIEIGGEAGHIALDRLSSVIGRIQSPWRPATADESFEIVRRRLCMPIEPDKFPARDAVAKAFGDLYRSQASEFPAECREGSYEGRIKAAYPIHPELFDRLYHDWSTLPRFQRTRGVLRLMAAVIHTLWQADDRSLLIMPGVVPVGERAVQTELSRYLDDNWAPVLDADVDGAGSLPIKLDGDNPNLGRYSACRRVARTVFLGSAPLARMPHKGLEDRSVKLGCVQPGESPAVFGDALRKLTDHATFLYVDGKRYWYATQPSVMRLALERSQQYGDDEIREVILGRLRADKNRGDFSAVHVAPASSGDVPDEAEARLVILGPTTAHSAHAKDSPALGSAGGILADRGVAPRRYRNMLVFLAPDATRLRDLESTVRQYLAWLSIHEEREQLNLDAHQSRQAETKCSQWDEGVKAQIPETYHWLLVPSQPMGQEDVSWDDVKVQGTEALAVRAAKKLGTEECLITEFSATRLRMELDRVPLWQNDHVGVRELWEYFAQYLYLPRLRDSKVLMEAIQAGVASLSWQSDAFAYAEAWDEGAGRYSGLHAGQHMGVHMDGHSVLVKPDVAQKQLEEEAGEVAPASPTGEEPGEVLGVPPLPKGPGLPKRFHGTVRLDPLRLNRDADSISDAVVQHLAKLVDAEVEVTLEVSAESSAGFPDDVQRTVTENARTLKFEPFGFEEE